MGTFVLSPERFRFSTLIFFSSFRYAPPQWNAQVTSEGRSPCNVNCFNGDVQTLHAYIETLIAIPTPGYLLS